MSNKQELEISISETGEVSINVQGAKGSKCLDLTKELEDVIGTVTFREKKSSFYEQQDNEQVTVRGDR